jgi:hypothetical protein
MTFDGKDYVKHSQGRRATCSNRYQHSQGARPQSTDDARSSTGLDLDATAMIVRPQAAVRHRRLASQ